MQIGIDLGATKIEHVVLEDDGKELIREREKSPTDYKSTLDTIEAIVNKLDKNYNKKFELGICHPGSISNETGLIENAHNSPWLNNNPFQTDISKKLNRNVFCENDANCFALSESIDGSAKHYNFVFGIILGSGCGGGLVVNKKIVKGANNYAGEWGHNKHPFKEGTIEDFLSGLSLSRIFKKRFNKTLKTFVIFDLYRKKDTDAQQIINEYKEILARCLVIIITTLDPDAIVFGGGISNEIDFLDQIKKKTSSFINEPNLKTCLLYTSPSPRDRG